MPVKVVALVSVKPDADDAFVAAAKICVAASRAEAGVLHYELWRETDGERRFVFNELYTDDAAVQQHMASDHFKAFGLAARDLAAARPTIIVTHPVDVADG
ncbi:MULTISPECIES: putative quinol monooxygenase [unclassified Sphingomonas]|uniref:putative quinol monooxygenase n=1 Tax=unclassified Sphingomonas TaxID=196159 RepID=UPI001F594071|nr:MULTISPECIES: putative quinol monooxygenase [unclassified Sphingomonas]